MASAIPISKLLSDFMNYSSPFPAERYRNAPIRLIRAHLPSWAEQPALNYRLENVEPGKRSIKEEAD
jgi:hypothetical protein